MLVRRKCSIIFFGCHFFADLYSFDRDENAAVDTYESVCRVYERLFDRLGLPALRGMYV